MRGGSKDGRNVWNHVWSLDAFYTITRLVVKL